MLKSKYSSSKWKKIVVGPKPFTPEEMRIVEARRNFKWKHVGFSSNGDAIFEVENQSLRTIPYLSIGIRDGGGIKLVGDVWLNVDNIQPGEKTCVIQDCYKDRILPDELEAFDLLEPIPEKRKILGI